MTPSPLTPETAFWDGRAVDLQVQSVLYCIEPDRVERMLEAVAISCGFAQRAGTCLRASVKLGDASPERSVSEVAIGRWQQRFRSVFELSYRSFGENSGSARGHNRLGLESDSDFLLVINPDVVVSPHLIEALLSPFLRAGVGMVEAKQLPLEHPKDYDLETGATEWAVAACAMIPARLFIRLGGFDAETFFLYCDDVDLSWRIRQIGFRIVFQPSAVAFHDKRLTVEGRWRPTQAERYYSAEAALLLAYKWSRPDLAERLRRQLSKSPDLAAQSAAAAFMKRRAEGRLPTPTDPGHEVGYFRGGQYSPNRFAL